MPEIAITSQPEIAITYIALTMAVNCIDMVGKAAAKAVAKAMPKSKSKGKGKGQGKSDKGRREVKGKAKGQVKGQGPDKGQGKGKVKGKAKCINRLHDGCKGGGRTCGLEFLGSEQEMREAIAYRRFLEIVADESSSD